jgi:hypothetical protein
LGSEFPKVAILVLFEIAFLKEVGELYNGGFFSKFTPFVCLTLERRRRAQVRKIN